MSKGPTATELLQVYNDEGWLKRFTDFSDLMEMLQDCIIEDNYAVPEDLNEALPLSAAGRELKTRLITKEAVPAKEAHLMCALSVGNEDLHVDIEQIDIEALRVVISGQITTKRVRFPLIFGRHLYDAYADEHEDEKDFLSSEETKRLLNAIPMGVFQYGRFVIGPSGLTVSEHPRSIPFSRRVRAYHCSDPACRQLHTVLLSTGHNAQINAHRDKLSRILEQDASKAADWAGLADEARGLHQSYFGHRWLAPILPLLGDALDRAEMRSLISALEIQDDTEIKTSQPMDDAELLERSLHFSDAELMTSLDRLVRAETIKVPSGEVRRPVSAAHLKSGAYRFAPELGAHGVRLVSEAAGLALLRARDLIKNIYLADNEAERQELEWQLRNIDGVSVEVRLDEYLRTAEPAEALTRLVLSRKTSAIAASEIAGIGDIEGATDKEVIDRLAWKLGFDFGSAGDEHEKFWSLHEKLSAAVQSWLGTQALDADEFRGLASTFFAELEGVLSKSLGFASWALLCDHASGSPSFEYDVERHQSEGLAVLADNYRTLIPKGPEKLDFNGVATLHRYVRAFGALAEVLESMQSLGNSYERPPDAYPDYAKHAGLQVYPFASTVPFLDLAEHSQRRIVEGLREVTTTLLAGDVVHIRNDYSHYRRTSPEVERMAKALEEILRAVRGIENLGFGLNLCIPTGTASDRWGRVVVEFAGPRSLSHRINRPSSLEWAGLPSLSRAQYLVRAAAFEDANEVLRFTPKYSSAYSQLWADYPRPRKRVPRTIEATSGPA